MPDTTNVVKANIQIAIISIGFVMPNDESNMTPFDERVMMICDTESMNAMVNCVKCCGYVITQYKHNNIIHCLLHTNVTRYFQQNCFN